MRTKEGPCLNLADRATLPDFTLTYCDDTKKGVPSSQIVNGKENP